jgi:DNA-binding winged helix-turn-helix (wHTH) protein/tetratricopeptide (TPR) repeat protein
MQRGPVLRFDDFELDVAARELRRKGRRIRLAPQPFRLLALLAASEGRVIDREAIRKELWNSTHVDFEHGVNFCVREIRRALRDRAERPKYVETLPRQGYRFLASVDALKQSSGAPAIVDPKVNLADLLTEGRRLLREMGVGTLEQSRRLFEEALRLDPDCAMAHCGLGAACAMRFISRSEPNDLELARLHLERATALDRELAEPYPWLCYVYIRAGETEKSFEAGERGVQLLPDLVHAQYFLGTIYFASCEGGTGSHCKALSHLLKASTSEQRWQPTWMVLSLLCLLNGAYDAALKFAKRLFELQGSGGKATRFPGAENLMGAIALRNGDFAGARKWFSESMATLSASDHTYAESMRAWCACLLGDLELRQNNPHAALTNYRLAWQIVQESPPILSQERHAARALVGLAAAYAMTGEQERARQLLAQAEQGLPACLPLRLSTPATYLAELYYAFSVACVSLGDFDGAMVRLRQAFKSGWHDAHWLKRDQRIEPLPRHPAFLSLLEEIADMAQTVTDLGNGEGSFASFR